METIDRMYAEFAGTPRATKPLIWVTGFSCSFFSGPCSLFLRDRVDQHAEPFDFHLAYVTGLHL